MATETTSDDITYPGGNVRLFVEAALGEGASVVPSEAQAHYLLHVMRARPGSRVRLFNGRDGEWRAAIAIVTKRGLTLTCEAQIAPQTRAPDLWLLFAPLKRAPIDFLAQKATELGVARLAPVFTRRTVAERVNTERLRANCIEAAEQSARRDVPEVLEPVVLARALEGWDAGRALFFCDEAGDARPLAAAAAGARGQRAAVLIGPEGGFAPEERAMIRGLTACVPVTLGARLLRADTAALAALAVWQAVAGDWGGAGDPALPAVPAPGA